MEKTLKFSEECIDVPNDDKAIFKHAPISLLFNKWETWMKKDTGLSDVASWVLLTQKKCASLSATSYSTKLSGKYERKNLALYSDDELTNFENIVDQPQKKN